jgi:flagellar assembly protein FliH
MQQQPTAPNQASLPAAERPGAGERIEVFAYPHDPAAPSVPGWNGWAESAGDGAAADPGHSSGGNTHSAAEFEARLAEETRRAFEAGRERGTQDERKAQSAAKVAEEAAAEERQKRQMAALAGSFALERDRYLQAVEQEVVKLALAVAARILRREAQMDPLLLTGAVRVALGQLSASTEVRLRVPESELDLWTEAMALLPNLPVKPEVACGEGMRLGECLVETRLGTVDLGIRAQLGEIERGFFDRAGRSRLVHELPQNRSAIAGLDAAPIREGLR